MALPVFSTEVAVTMYILGIVGSEAAKFTPHTETLAREKIREFIAAAMIKAWPNQVAVCSGACHLGGIDVWAVEEAKLLNLTTIEHPPKVMSWEQGYKPRNIQIAKDSHEVVCITVKELPPGYTGMRFKMCYHCKTTAHVKSGGCWTVKYAQSLGKPGHIEVIGE